MFSKINQMIDKYNTIVISRHKAPDYDAYGAQFGLYYGILAKYPKKDVYLIGDDNKLNHFKPMDILADDVIYNSLMIIVDTAVKQMLIDDAYKKAKALIVIDHHQNDSDLPYDIFFQDTKAASASEIIASFLIEHDYPINLAAAKALYMGIISDTGRFLYSSVKSKTLVIAAKLIDKGIDIQEIYNLMYLESLKSKKMKMEYLSDFTLSQNGVGYRFIDESFLSKYNVSSQTASRALVNQLSGINEIPIWANFTYDKEQNKVLCELRSRMIEIVEIAKKYGGGGHKLACGCVVDNFLQAMNVVDDLDKLLGEKNETGNN